MEIINIDMYNGQQKEFSSDYFVGNLDGSVLLTPYLSQLGCSQGCLDCFCGGANCGGFHGGCSTAYVPCTKMIR